MIKQRLGIEALMTPGHHGEFKVMADGQTIAERGGNWFTRSFGAGYPDLDKVVDQIATRAAGATRR